MNCDCKATLLAYNNANQAVATNGVISTPVVLTSGCGIFSCPATTIKKPGTYLINVSANVVADIIGAITLQLSNNGILIPAAIAEITAATTTDVNNINFTYLLTVKKSCECIDNTAVLTLLNTGVPATYNNIVMTVVRV